MRSRRGHAKGSKLVPALVTLAALGALVLIFRSAKPAAPLPSSTP